jgi:hypothetical protein
MPRRRDPADRRLLLRDIRIAPSIRKKYINMTRKTRISLVRASSALCAIGAMHRPFAKEHQHEGSLQRHGAATILQ